MKKFNFTLSGLMVAVVLVLFLQCSKSSDSTPAPAASGCTFTFKGTSYTLANSVCSTDVGGSGKINAATNATASQLLTLNKDTGDDGIVFSLDAINVTGTNVYTSYGTGGTFSINISGTTWTFNGNLVNTDETDSGAITGSCVCTINN